MSVSVADRTGQATGTGLSTGTDPATFPAEAPRVGSDGALGNPPAAAVTPAGAVASASVVTPARDETLGDRARRFVSDESGSSEVEYILLTALIVLPMSVLFFYLLVSSFAFYFGRVGWWINLPFP